MKQGDLEEYLFKIIKPALEQYAKERNIDIEDLLLQSIKLEDTGLFNYKGHQSTVYNRLRDSNITNLKELFDAYNSNTINYGKNELKSNHNYYIHHEIDGIISLLRYKYLGIKSNKLKDLLDYNIEYMCDVFNAQDENEFIDLDIFAVPSEFYMILKSCGFNHVGVKVLIGIAYKAKINNVTLGDFLTNLSLDVIKDKFSKIPQELNPFLNVLNIIIDFYKNYDKTEIESHKKY